MSSTPLEKSKAILNRPFYGMSNMAQYEEISKLGQGTFGAVVKARNLKDKKLVALKSIIVHNQKGGFPITALREVNIMKKLKDKNVLQLLDLVCKRQSDIKGVKKLPIFYMVTPYMSYDLSGLLNNPKVKFSMAQIKCIMQQLLEGINYIHGQHYFHRDIKAANLLIDHHGILKIGDFGLARNYEGPAPQKGKGPCGSVRRYTGLVVTRWYRAPELLLGNQRYTTAIDLWGIGCVFAELFEQQPILQGKSDLDQGRIIFELVGPPNQSNWPDYDKLPHANQFSFPASRRSLEKRFARTGPQGLSLLDGLLKLDPLKRFNALDALDHAFFKSAPLPCKCIELARFEDSHEMDADKFKEQEKRSKTMANETWSSAASGRQQPNVDPLPRAPAYDTRYPPNLASKRPIPSGPKPHIPTEPASHAASRAVAPHRNGPSKYHVNDMMAVTNRAPSLPDTPSTSSSGRSFLKENQLRDSYAPSRDNHQGYPSKRSRRDPGDHYHYRDGNSQTHGGYRRPHDYYGDRWSSNESDRERSRGRDQQDIKLDYSDDTLSLKSKLSNKTRTTNDSARSLPPPPPPPKK